jgi:tRNA-specific 2-thiouridylase
MQTAPSPHSKVLVALSGNLMSAVVAALLRHQGFQVLGVFFQINGSNQNENAEKSARKLALSLVKVDLREQFKYWVQDHIVHQMAANRVPEPQLIGTQRLLIENLLLKAEELKCPYVATGHFARIALDPSTQTPRLLRTLEADQSYLLSGVSSAQLEKFILPIGDLSPAAAEKLAVEMGLDLKLSEGTGFSDVPEELFVKIADQSIPEGLKVPGQVRTQEGSVVGEHRGLFQYQLGQKHSLPQNRGKQEAWIVVGTDLISQSLILGPESALEAQAAVAKDAHWIRPLNGLKILKCQARIGTKPGAPLLDCFVTLFENDLLEVEFNQRVRMLLPGQSIVFYQEDEVLGGAFIEKIRKPS